MEILQRFQNKYFRIILNASWYVTNDLDVPLETRLKDPAKDTPMEKKHSNVLATNLMKEVKTMLVEKKITSRLMFLTVL